MSNIYTAGLNNVGSYQVSGIPYASGSIATGRNGSPCLLEFPYVTRWVMIVNNDSTDLKVGFSQHGLDTGNNYFTVPATVDVTPRLELKVTELYFTGSGNFDVVCGLTNLPISRVNNISPVAGTNWSGSVGVG